MKQQHEELLGAWLRLSTAINNDRLTSDLPYNEALLCNILYRHELQHLTASHSEYDCEASEHTSDAASETDSRTASDDTYDAASETDSRTASNDTSDANSETDSGTASDGASDTNSASGSLGMTATDLCRCSKMLKSQMNRTLQSMEEKGIILRRRSDTDRRLVHIVLNKESDLYHRQHEKILALVQQITEKLGMDQIDCIIDMFTKIADTADEVLT